MEQLVLPNCFPKTKNFEHQYLEIMKDILNNGQKRPDRTGTGTIQVFGRSITHDFADGFPLLTTKKMYIPAILHEFLWFLKGTEDAQYLIDNNVRIWDEWMLDDVCLTCDGKGWYEGPFEDSYGRYIASSNRDHIPCYACNGSGGSVTKRKNGKILPKTYGYQWRHFAGRVDQIKMAINTIKQNPFSRRNLVSAWNPADLDQTALPWCHVMFQFNVTVDGKLDILVFQRSADWFLGVPFDLASYGYMLHTVASVTDLVPGKMIYHFGDSHIYLNHVEQCRLQLSREQYELPKLLLNKKSDIDHYVFDDYTIIDYKSHSTIKAQVSI